MAVQVLELTPVLQSLRPDEEASAEAAAAADVAEADLKAVAELARLALQQCGKEVPEALQQLVFALHDEGIIAVPRFPAFQDAVIRLCTDYWLAEAPDANVVSVQMVRREPC